MAGRSAGSQGRLPEFYVNAVVRGQTIDPRVRSALAELWPWFWEYVGQQLGDPCCAADLADEVACRVSAYVEASAAGVRSLVGLCRVTGMNLVTSTKSREGRIEYRGLSHEVERSLDPTAPGWQEEVEVAILVDQVLRGHDPENAVLEEGLRQARNEKNRAAEAQLLIVAGSHDMGPTTEVRSCPQIPRIPYSRRVSTHREHL